MLRLFSDYQIRTRDIDTLKRQLRYKLGGYKVAIKDISKNNLLYRGVQWQQRPSKIDDVSYPPPDKAKLNRANRLGQPIFYCSRAAPAVFYELGAKQGDLIALSEWEIAEPLWMHHLGYHQDALQKLGTHSTVMRQQLTYPIPNETKSNTRLRRQLSLAFTEDVPRGQEYKYKQSIAINELLFDGASPLPTYLDGPKIGRAAGTVYPAIQMQGSADNIAIWPEFVDDTLRIKSIRYVLVECADKAKSSYTFLTEAFSRTFSGRNIIWQDNLPPEIQCRSRITLEDNVWILRDGFNRVYDQHP